ncbi:MAG TPA: hypothetical protein VF528_16685 [Pyrinomonadaceae bacterium]
MSTAQSILLVGIIGFYSLLFVALLIRASLECWRAAKIAAPELKPTSRGEAQRFGRSWTHATRHEHLA